MSLIRSNPRASSRRSSRLRHSTLLLPVLAIGAGLASGADQPATNPAQPAYEKEIRPLLQQFCLGCHGAQHPSGGVNLARYATATDLQRDQTTWRKVLVQLRERSMSPRGAPRLA